MALFKDVKYGDYITFPAKWVYKRHLVVLNKTADMLVGLELKPSIFDESVRIKFVEYRKSEWIKVKDEPTWREHGERGNIDRNIKTLLISNVFEWLIT